jgi:hypothetical protein
LEGHPPFRFICPCPSPGQFYLLVDLLRPIIETTFLLKNPFWRREMAYPLWREEIAFMMRVIVEM